METESETGMGKHGLPHMLRGFVYSRQESFFGIFLRQRKGIEVGMTSYGTGGVVYFYDAGSGFRAPSASRKKTIS